jgi:RimJ/RimL family protein N-acetyltransferase
MGEPHVVTLRATRDGDLDALFAFEQDEAAVRMAAFTPPDPSDRAMFDAHWRRLLADDSVVKRTIVDEGAVAGNVGVWEHEGRLFVGYWLGREFWGAGVASAALAAFLEGETERPLYAGVVPHNAGSLRVLAKCGFAVCGEEDGRVILRLD